MWFIRLVKNNNPVTKERSMWFEQHMKEAEKWGVKVHQTYFTLGRYDIVSILEAPDEKTAMRYGLALWPEATSETLVAVSREEVNKWMK